ncbi:hypothetical protein [Streptosporangium pseudovulgare]|uniref:Uncharacterized protein n=1 Tax=Streptosporangium pseudovulgare TaxID=35765 RepID=A0ABQ2R502_9ACTN|nr:hypothetical protein [Streptosporangium pseudovulgare]GGQ14041.1 hypothetical protein GCM10010140_50340 [Streptosporangium pseudovulgare]
MAFPDCGPGRSLYLALRGRHRRLELLGLLLAGVGLALGLVGMADSALGVIDPNPWAPVINTGEHVGLAFINPSSFHVLEAGPIPLVFSATWILLGLGLLHADGTVAPQVRTGTDR